MFIYVYGFFSLFHGHLFFYTYAYVFKLSNVQYVWVLSLPGGKYAEYADADEEDAAPDLLVDGEHTGQINVEVCIDDMYTYVNI